MTPEKRRQLAETKKKQVIENYFYIDCGVDTTIREAYTKGFNLAYDKCMKAKRVLTLKDWMEPIEDTEKYFDLWAVSDNGTEVNIGLLTYGMIDDCADFEVVKVRESPKSDNVIEIRIDMSAETAREIIKKHNSKYRTETVSQCDCVQTFQMLLNQNTAMQGADLTQITEQK